MVAHLKRQGQPVYLEAVTAARTRTAAGAPEPTRRSSTRASSGLRAATSTTRRSRSCCGDKKASTSYIQRRLQIGYNRAASLMERMEKEGIVGAANHAGKREILLETADGGREDDD